MPIQGQRISMRMIGLLTASVFLACPVLHANNYKGAEYRTKASYTYGRFETRMKSTQREGVLSSFFTYHEIVTGNDWNEIDIEILGRYQDDIQYNTITPGQTNHVSHHNCGFNPHLDFHVYGIEWTPEYVAWFIDSVEVYRQSGAHIATLVNDQKVMMNIWNPIYDSWVGKWNEAVLPAFAYYDWVSYAAYTPGAGSVGTGNNFTPQWRDDLDSWDQTRWEKGAHTFTGNQCDFVPDNIIFKDGVMILCLTKNDALGYTDLYPPSIMSARTESNTIRILFTEEVDKTSAEDISNYTVIGAAFSSARLLDDLKTVVLSVDYSDSVSILAVQGIKDRFLPANAMSLHAPTLIRQKHLTLPIKINVGGPAYGQFLPDQLWNDTTEYGYMDLLRTASYPNITFNGTDGEIFKTDRSGLAKYRIRVPNGNYAVTLMMAENYWTEAGKRIMDIWVQGKLVEKNLDLFQRVGKSIPYQKTVVDVAVPDGVLDIHFSGVIDYPLINGITVLWLGTGVNRNDVKLPERFFLGQNYPNPFNGSTIISYSLPIEDRLTLKVFDLLGRVVDQKDLGVQGPGSHSFSWSPERGAGGLSSGIYFYTIVGMQGGQVEKMLLLR